MAFLVPVADALRKELITVEAELAITDPVMSKKLSGIRTDIKENQQSEWSLALRQTSIESKIASFERNGHENLFSDEDEGSSNAVEILDYYRKLQSSILGKEGRDYLKSALKTGIRMQEGLNSQLSLLETASTNEEKCAAAEKTRFAWVQYKFKIQEAHDFVATNTDLYRSSFRIGKERLKRSTRYVLFQMDSVRDYNDGKGPQSETIGSLMYDISKRVNNIETKLKTSGCF
jgi:hypothetical protein